MGYKKIHYLIYQDKEPTYLCNWACNITMSKTTKDKMKVTCKNCIRKLKKMGDIDG